MTCLPFSGRLKRQTTFPSRMTGNNDQYSGVCLGKPLYLAAALALRAFCFIGLPQQMSSSA